MLKARYERFDCGRQSDRDKADKLLVKHETYEVERVNMGQSLTTVKLKGFNTTFNSVLFDFYDENGAPVNIYKNPRYNSYLAAVKIRRNV